MAYLVSHSDKVILNRYDLEGLHNAMFCELKATLEGPEQDYRAGAMAAVELMLGHEFNTQADFMRAFNELAGKWAGVAG